MPRPDRRLVENKGSILKSSDRSSFHMKVLLLKVPILKVPHKSSSARRSVSLYFKVFLFNFHVKTLFKNKLCFFKNMFVFFEHIE